MLQIGTCRSCTLACLLWCMAFLHVRQVRCVHNSHKNFLLWKRFRSCECIRKLESERSVIGRETGPKPLQVSRRSAWPGNKNGGTSACVTWLRASLVACPVQDLIIILLHFFFWWHLPHFFVFGEIYLWRVDDDVDWHTKMVAFKRVTWVWINIEVWKDPAARDMHAKSSWFT
jgi:hypothetical protein